MVAQQFVELLEGVQFPYVSPAPVVKWISRESSELVVRVRILPGAPMWACSSVVEQRTLNPRVESSILSRPSKKTREST